MSHAVTVTDLQLRRPGFTLGPLSCSVKAGGRLAIVGPSGSGKTTLLRCIAGFERPDHGTIQIGDRIVAGPSTHVEPAQRGVGMVFQDGALWSHMTALKHLTFAAPGMSNADAAALLERAGLGAQANKKPPQMSGGEAQRLGLVRALAPSPGVLLLDEPLRSVDVHQRDGLVLLVRTLTDERDITTVLVTHDRDEALALATDLVVLRDGQLVEQGPAIELLQRPQTAFTAAFLLGAACLPTTTTGDRVDTAFGTFARADAKTHGTGPDDLRLVLLPGDACVLAAGEPAAHRAEARVLASIPEQSGFRLSLAVGDQIVHTHHQTTLPLGSTTTLSLAAPRLLPWQRTQPSRNGEPRP